MKALYENVLVAPEAPKENKSATGLIIPAGSAGAVAMGKIISAGVSVPDLGADDVVAYNSHKAIEITVKGQKYVVVHKDDLYITI